ncbi:MAG: PKD domain-containing protein [Thermoplasmatales archaeon]|nr:PKD domain-containing protein [Thermoplasmatales archaeon]
MMKKTMIIGIIAFSLLAATTFSVKAEDQTYILSDDVGDVYDELGELHPEIENIDIKQLTYTKEDRRVSIEFEFVGNLEESDTLSVVFFLVTSKDVYTGGYSAGEVIVFNMESDDLYVTVSGFGTTKVTFTFELTDEAERHSSLIGLTEIEIDDETYTDDVSDLDALLEVAIGGPSTGKTGESIDFTASLEGGIEPYYWEWDFDDGETSTEQNPTHEFTEPGVYNVTVFVYDALETSGLNITTITIEAGTDGDSSSASGSGLTMFIALIAIIVIAGVAVLVYFIRK